MGMSFPMNNTVDDIEITTRIAEPGETIENGRPHPGFQTDFTGGPWDGDCWRYATEELAIQEHLKAVDQLTNM